MDALEDRDYGTISLWALPSPQILLSHGFSPNIQELPNPELATLAKKQHSRDYRMCVNEWLLEVWILQSCFSYAATEIK